MGFLWAALIDPGVNAWARENLRVRQHMIQTRPPLLPIDSTQHCA